MSSATVGMVRPQVENPPSGGVFGKPPSPPAVPSMKKKKPSVGVPKEGTKPPKTGKPERSGGKPPQRSGAKPPQKPEDPIAIMGGGKPKKESY